MPQLLYHSVEEALQAIASSVRRSSLIRYVFACFQERTTISLLRSR